ncbi:MAG: glycine C-acetyltransferase [Candidatus Dadabacteria bacterium]|nr:MAG: glycine C-acetyltransferase [Candidatus Dadabacteria bacterium]
MISKQVLDDIKSVLNEIKESGLYKEERIITSAQAPVITVGDREVLNFCANNYLGLANNSVLKEAACQGINRWGFGLSSVRFICGTQKIHKELERALADFLGFDDAILYTSCFDANGGLFECLLSAEDAVVSDELNHASIIDGIRLCKAKRYRYLHSNMESLRSSLQEARDSGAKKIMIATDGVFSMDGDLAKLPEICALAEEFKAIVMVDDSHATGFFGEGGRGTPAFFNVEGKVDILTSTLGKALGGAVGGFTVSSKEVVDLLRQRSRPYLFSNSVPPAIVFAELKCLQMLREADNLRNTLKENTSLFREEMKKAGFNILGEHHPIVPVMLGDAKLAVKMADCLLKEGIYVIGFSYPVVPKGKARIRVQLSAAHTKEHIEKAVSAFIKVGKELNVI